MSPACHRAPPRFARSGARRATHWPPRQRPPFAAKSQTTAPRASQESRAWPRPSATQRASRPLHIAGHGPAVAGRCQHAADRCPHIAGSRAHIARRRRLHLASGATAHRLRDPDRKQPGQHTQPQPSNFPSLDLLADPVPAASKAAPAPSRGATRIIAKIANYSGVGLAKPWRRPARTAARSSAPWL